jgi:hypothetical protein
MQGYNEFETSGAFWKQAYSDNGKLYYCNNPMCPPDEWERKQRLLPSAFHRIAAK